ncbi:MAG: hypothetical protein LBR38_00830 [Synergistaceae bacterium]|jgi:lipopolysaccharide biosynthesis glycosyltransferase|nr:hypothetical protein [Synergistaceae bacterium]
MPETSDIIHVVLAVHDPKGTYSRHAGVVMASIFENTKSRVLVHILHDDTLTAHNRSLLTETASMYKQGVEFHDISSYMEQMMNEDVQNALGIWSVGTMFRLAIPDVISADKVIYLDCDIIVHMDIRELWDIPMGDFPIAGVRHDMVYKRFSASALRLRIMKFDAKDYLVAGLIVMNLSLIRAKYDMTRQIQPWYKRYGHYARCPDQDFINSYFSGKIKFLDRKFLATEPQEGGVILHAVYKPWSEPIGCLMDRLYWETFLKTPWGMHLTPREVVNVMLDVIQGLPYRHLKTGNCYARILYRLRQDLFNSDVILIVKILWQELRHMLFHKER